MVMTDHACFKGSFNTSGATFAATITNEKSMEEVEFGRIYTTNPNPAKYTCEQMPVNGGSFQEYYDGALQYRVPTHTHTHPTRLGRAHSVHAALHYVLHGGAGVCVHVGLVNEECTLNVQ